MHHIFKKLFIFLISCYTFTAFSQEKYIQYYQAINQAELAICDSNFSQATQYYKQAFKINPDKPFTAHLLNAFHAAMDCKEYSIAEKYLAKVLSRGLSSDYIQEKILPPYKTAQQSVIKNILAKHPNDTIRKHPLIQKLNDMVDWDQEVRGYYSKLNNGAYMVDSVYTVDSINAAELKKIFEKYGVPNEDMLGNRKDYNTSKYGVRDYDIIIYHHNGGHVGGRPSHTLDTILWNAVTTFDYNLRNFEKKINNNPIQSTFQYKSINIQVPTTISGAYYEGKIYPEYFDKASEQKINAERAQLGLESLDDHRRKIIANNQAKNKNSVLYKYSLPTFMLVQDAENEQQLNEWLKKNGKDAIHKKSLHESMHQPTYKQLPAFDVGIIYDWYVINQTTYEDYHGRLKKYNKEYQLGKIYYDEWKNRKEPLPWNYNAEIISNPHLDTKTTLGVENRTILPDGYKLFIEDGFGSMHFWGGFRNVEVVFFNDTLISFKANVDTVFHKVIERRIGAAHKIIIKNDTLPCPENKMVFIPHSKKRQHIWEKNGIKMETAVTEYITNKCTKRAKNVFRMYDEQKYQTYLNKVKTGREKLKAKN